MKKALIILLLAACGMVKTSQAVVISWASEALPDGTTSASLVYVSEEGGDPIVIATASGYAIDGSYLYEQTSTDSTTRSSGYYYVIAYVGAASYESVEQLAYNDSKVSTSEMDPAETFLVTFVPEPGIATLLCIGAAAAALRRKQRG